ncbi:MAG: zinc ribbon domain-containing protein [Lachnospiraceae bacterium]|jgi:uncharacterized membrane protein YvbJ|nr:zinc ribbon domain-containing protein [Lachnospiraceae bacterium]
MESNNRDRNYKFCPSCGAKIGKNDSFCTSCGMKLSGMNQSFKVDKGRKRNIIIVICILLITIIALSLVVFYSHLNKKSTISKSDKNGEISAEKEIKFKSGIYKYITVNEKNESVIIGDREASTFGIFYPDGEYTELQIEESNESNVNRSTITKMEEDYIRNSEMNTKVYHDIECDDNLNSNSSVIWTWQIIGKRLLIRAKGKDNIQDLKYYYNLKNLTLNERKVIRSDGTIMLWDKTSSVSNLNGEEGPKDGSSVSGKYIDKLVFISELPMK